MCVLSHQFPFNHYVSKALFVVTYSKWLLFHLKTCCPINQLMLNLTYIYIHRRTTISSPVNSLYVLFHFFIFVLFCFSKGRVARITMQTSDSISSLFTGLRMKWNTNSVWLLNCNRVFDQTTNLHSEDFIFLSMKKGNPVLATGLFFYQLVTAMSQRESNWSSKSVNSRECYLSSELFVVSLTYKP